MQPPRSKPTKDFAIPPAIPAIIREMRMSIILNNYLLNKDQYKVILINIRINFNNCPFGESISKFTRLTAESKLMY
jgi:hypothetical protein